MMKKIICLLFVLIFTFSLVSCNDEKTTTPGTTYSIDEGYVYPDNLNFTATKEFWEVLAVPEDTLKEMSTKALVNTVLNVPSDILLVMASSSDGKEPIFNEFIQNYNVLIELSQRFDRFEHIQAALDKYVTEIDKKVNAQYIEMLEYCVEL